MKHTRKIVVAVLVGMAVAGSLFAQDGRRGRGSPPGFPSIPSAPAAETVTVSGPLQLVNGHIAVAQDGQTYYADQLGRWVGFIEGLREGAQVTLTGNVEPFDTDYSRLRITAMTINGKVYDNLDYGRRSGPMMAHSAPPRWGPRGGQQRGRSYR
jgi:hypothetical protein